MVNNIGRQVVEYFAGEFFGTCHAYEPLIVVAEDLSNIYAQSAWQPQIGAVRKISKESGKPVFADRKPLV